MIDLPHKLRRYLAMDPKIDPEEAFGRPAAVLIPLYWHDDEWHALFTRRTDHVEEHRGQVSFPGGMIEAEDLNHEQAALREANEEIGIHPQDVDILGRLKPTRTITHFLITPILGVIPWPYELRCNPNEVASTFGVPLQWLADPANLELRKYKPSEHGPLYEVHFFKAYQGEVIWGATGRIVVQFLKVLREVLENEKRSEG
ncbi:MAG TPA: CoA pyrophosphatase [Anaerolineae bacterium]|nr:CoA pyrophosphatase [Anaerolineae bacterium]